VFVLSSGWGEWRLPEKYKGSQESFNRVLRIS